MVRMGQGGIGNGRNKAKGKEGGIGGALLHQILNLVLPMYVLRLQNSQCRCEKPHCEAWSFLGEGDNTPLPHDKTASILHGVTGCSRCLELQQNWAVRKPFP